MTLIDPTILTTDVEDSFAVFSTNGLFYVRPVYPDGRVGVSITECETRMHAEIIRDELIEHTNSWSKVVS